MDEKKYDPEYCKKSVRAPGTWPRFYQCKKKARVDGFCTLHHPDAVLKRQQERDAKSDKKWDASRRKHLSLGKLDALQLAVESVLPTLEHQTYKVLAAALAASKDFS